jgi:tRNA-specific adenosine deaminase 1
VLIKIARPDAPVCLSKSCTDKLTLAQFTTFLKSITTLFLSPRHAYLYALVLPSSQAISKSLVRAFSAEGRLNSIIDTHSQTFQDPYSFHPFQILTTSHEFDFSRRTTEPLHHPDNGRKPSFVTWNKALIWSPTFQEVLTNGIIQGRKQDDIKGASVISRRRMWLMAKDMAGMLKDDRLKVLLDGRTYAEVKEKPAELRKRRRVKEVVTAGLEGWVGNEGDDEWSLRV